MTMGRIRETLQKGAKKERLSREDALSLGSLLDRNGIHRLGEAANENRTLRFGKRATYVANVQINPSNVCEGACGFCRYSAKSETDSNAYVLTQEEILTRVKELDPVEVHIVGGMNQIWRFERYRELLKAIKELRPSCYIKGFTAVEIDFFAREEGCSSKDILTKFREAGLDAMPGGGAELFSARMRKRYCPNKLSPEGWLTIHGEAHGMGMTTNATMLYGLDETHEERVEHLLAIRDAQDKTRGYSCFIPLPYQPGKDSPVTDGPSPVLNLGVIALSRLVLDNVDHIKAYWPMIGESTASAALWWGADDLDGTIGQERIAHAAGAKTPRALSRERMRETIHSGGFVPVERDGAFNELGPELENGIKGSGHD